MNAATGGWFTGGGCDVTLMACVTVAVAPALSVTVSRAVKDPAVAKVCETVRPVPALLSPKSQA